MTKKRVLILYYSESGSTKRMADLIGEGMSEYDVIVDVFSVNDIDPEKLERYNGIVIGSPTYFSNVAWQVKKLIDESITQYRNSRQLSSKVCLCFTSSGTMRDAKDCVRMLELAFGFHHKMDMVPSITRVSGDNWEKVAEKCRENGRELARRITLN
jgi:multimeric flavodoxin WrbA